jgi:hypothetical protein
VCFVASTPAGSTGLFADLYRRAESGELPDAVAHHATTPESNPTIGPAFLEAERLTLGEEHFRSEYLASFEGGGGQFFSIDEIREVVSQRREALPSDGRGWVCALDPSSGGGDPFACVLVGRDTRPGFEGRLIVGQVERWLPRRSKLPLSLRSRAERDLWVDSVLDRVAATAKRFRAAVVSDQHVPGVVVDELHKRGVHGVRIVPWTATSRTDAFQALRARVATERIELVQNEQLLAELRRVRTRFRAGSSIVEVPRIGDSHGDLAMALSLAVATLDRHAAAQPLRTSSAVVGLATMRHRNSRRLLSDTGGPAARDAELEARAGVRRNDPISGRAPRCTQLQPGGDRRRGGTPPAPPALAGFLEGTVKRHPAREHAKDRIAKAEAARWQARERLREEKRSKRRALEEAASTPRRTERGGDG